MNYDDQKQSPVTITSESVKTEDMYEVILHNDDINEAGYVVASLMRVFKHNKHLAVKIMLEAHNCGKSVAEVEAETMAKLHKDQLQSCGLVVSVSRI